MTRSQRMLVGFGLGVATGLFLGEIAAPLGIVADAFIRLLQMAVLPYIVVSLVGALGRLDSRSATSIARAGTGALLAIWGLTLVLVVLMPVVFPAWKTGAFFSTSLLEPPASFDFVGQYIPANPFRSLADNVVPAVVLFSIALGVGVMTVPRRAPLLADLGILEQALTRVNDFVVALTPIGLFAIGASTVATLGMEELGRVQVYVVCFIVSALLLTFGLLPALVAAVTPVRHRDVLRAARDPLLTAFATGSLFVVLPQLAEQAKRLLATAGATDADGEATVDVVVPVSFTFPHAGKVLTLAFVPFAAWASGITLGSSQTAMLAVAGLGAIFGSVNVALPYLLDLFGIPADMFQVFLAVGVVNFRVATLVATMHTLVLALLATATVTGQLTFRWRSVVRLAGFATLAIAGSFAVLQLGVTHLLRQTDTRAYLVMERVSLAEATDVVVHRTAPSVPALPASGSVLARARERGVLRVGYDPDALPLSYFNARDELVGFDVDMAHILARDLGLGLEFVPVDRSRLAAELDGGLYDVAMTAVAITTDRAGSMAFARSHLDFTMAFVVRDDRRGDFDSREHVQAQRGLRIAIGGEGYYADKIRRYLPDAELVTVRSLPEFFDRQGTDDLDAMVHAAEIASAWTLIRPQFTVVVPQPDRLRVPVAYAVASRETELRDLLDTWILLKRSDQTIERLHRYWILGIDEIHRAPRWSVIRNVLGWVDRGR